MMNLNERLSDRWVAVILALVVLLLLLVTDPQIGITWDEPAYMAASESYAAWLGQVFTHPGEAFSQEMIDPYWEVNHEHPPLAKLWFGIVWSGARFVFGTLTAFRLGNMILVSALAVMLYKMVAEAYGRRSGLLAVAALFTMPRFFFHAHLIALDVPAAVAIFAFVYFFWKTKDHPGWGWTLALGAAWGLAVATKINAAFVMPSLFLWALLFQREARLFGRMVLASAVAFPVFLLSWPWLYPDLAARVKEYVLWITVDHWEIGQFYLHEFHMPPPWHFPFVMVVAVVPLTLLVFHFAGAVRTWKEKEQRPFGGLLVLNALVPLLALSIGQSMIYDNDRLLMPAFPYIAALVGIGVDWALRGLNAWLERKGRGSQQKLYAAGLVVLVFLPHLALAAPLYPHWLSYYSETVGGLPGATRLGLESTYWCETYSEVLPYINEHAEPGDIIWVEPWSHDMLVFYQMEGRLRDDVRITFPEWASSYLDEDAPLVRRSYPAADFIVLHHRQTAYVEGGPVFEIVDWLEGRDPSFRFEYQGVPLIDVYRP